MILHGRELKFKYTILSTKELANLCKDHDIKKLGELLQSDDTVEQFNTACSVIIALSNGYEKAKHFNDPEYTPRPITMEELETLTPDEFSDVLNCAMDAMNEKETVEIDPVKGKKAVTP